MDNNDTDASCLSEKLGEEAGGEAPSRCSLSERADHDGADYMVERARVLPARSELELQAVLKFKTNLLALKGDLERKLELHTNATYEAPRDLPSARTGVTNLGAEQLALNDQMTTLKREIAQCFRIKYSTHTETAQKEFNKLHTDLYQPCFKAMQERRKALRLYVDLLESLDHLSQSMDSTKTAIRSLSRASRRSLAVQNVERLCDIKSTSMALHVQEVGNLVSKLEDMAILPGFGAPIRCHIYKIKTQLAHLQARWEKKNISLELRRSELFFLTETDELELWFDDQWEKTKSVALQRFSVSEINRQLQEIKDNRELLEQAVEAVQAKSASLVARRNDYNRARRQAVNGREHQQHQTPSRAEGPLPAGDEQTQLQSLASAVRPVQGGTEELLQADDRDEHPGGDHGEERPGTALFSAPEAGRSGRTQAEASRPKRARVVSRQPGRTRHGAIKENTLDNSSYGGVYPEKTPPTATGPVLIPCPECQLKFKTNFNLNRHVEPWPQVCETHVKDSPNHYIEHQESNL